MPLEDEGRDQSNPSTSQEVPEIARKPPEPRAEAWNRLFLTTLHTNQPADT